MPPRRSCFFHFQKTLGPVSPGFNATTAFLLQSPPVCKIKTVIRFQCHHGVPASAPAAGASPTPVPGFNATTAFLLPGQPEAAAG